MLVLHRHLFLKIAIRRTHRCHSGTTPLPSDSNVWRQICCKFLKVTKSWVLNFTAEITFYFYATILRNSHFYSPQIRFFFLNAIQQNLKFSHKVVNLLKFENLTKCSFYDECNFVKLTFKIFFFNKMRNPTKVMILQKRNLNFCL